MTFFSQARQTCGTTHFIRSCTILHATDFGLPPNFEDWYIYINKFKNSLIQLLIPIKEIHSFKYNPVQSLSSLDKTSWWFITFKVCPVLKTKFKLTGLNQIFEFIYIYIYQSSKLGGTTMNPGHFSHKNLRPFNSITSWWNGNLYQHVINVSNSILKSYLAFYRSNQFLDFSFTECSSVLGTNFCTNRQIWRLISSLQWLIS
jgi:hypothetical protein